MDLIRGMGVPTPTFLARQFAQVKPLNFRAAPDRETLDDADFAPSPRLRRAVLDSICRAATQCATNDLGTEFWSHSDAHVKFS